MATLKEIQDCELNILKEFIKVCDRHNIPYYLCGGTFLGAVRHRGFIPWDDDVDIYIKYSDIRKLKKYCQKELPDNLFWQDYKTDRGFPLLNIRIRNTDTFMVSNRSSDDAEKAKKIQQGIWIDLMPMIKTAKKDKLFDLQLKFIHKLQKYVWESRKISILHGRYFLSTFAMRFREVFVNRFLILLFNKLVLLLQSNKSEYYYNLCIHSFNSFEKLKFMAYKRRFPVSWTKNTTKYKFEDCYMTAFSDFDAALTKKYGADYMTPVKYSHVSDYSEVILDINNKGI